MVILESLKGELDVVALLGRRKAIERSKARMNLVQIVPPLAKDPSFFNLVHSPDLVIILRQAIPDLLDRWRQCHLFHQYTNE